MTENSQGELVKRINLFNSLQKDPKSIFYLVRHVSRTLFNKTMKSTFEKDKVFVNLYDQSENKNFKKSNQDILPITTPFYDFKSNVDHSTLYSVGKPFELLHADIADTRFLAKSAVDPKYCLLLVDLFTSKVYIYHMKSRNLLAKKLKLFFEDKKNRRRGNIRLQTDLEFKQNQILKLNDEFNVEMFQTRLQGGKVFAAEQKIREFKKLVLRGNRLEKQQCQRLRPIELIKKVTLHMNNVNSTKYELAPETIEKRSLDPNDGKYFQEIYDFMRLKKIGNNRL